MTAWMVQPLVLLSLLEPARQRAGRASGLGALVVRFLGLGRLVVRGVVDTLAELGLSVDVGRADLGHGVDLGRVDHAGDSLAVHRGHRAGRGLEDRLVLLVVDGEEGAEDAELVITFAPGCTFDCSCWASADACGSCGT